MSAKLWGGRFKKKIDADFEKFSASLAWDCRLLPYDLQIDAAHVKALKKCGVLSSVEEKKFLRAISLLQKQCTDGKLRLDEREEDIHSALQSLLKSKLGSLADKLHTGRSRNDLVAQSSRLYCKDQSFKMIAMIDDLRCAFLAKAEQSQEILIPGMTHLQNAQALSYAHIFLSYTEMLSRAKERFRLSARFCDVCVLGSGALAGVTFNLDQKMMAKDLGLSSVTNNSYDVSGDRDFILDLLSSIFFASLQLSRIAEDLMLAQTKGFGTIEFDQPFCTGSSMMPQKKNADFAELLRGASGVFGANFTGMAFVLKGLPSSYNRDLQWDKKFIFDSVENFEKVLGIFTKAVKSLSVHKDAAKERLRDETLYATDLADYLVKKDIPFKTAHDQVGQIVSFAEENKVALSKIGLDIYQKFSPKISGDVYALFEATHSVRLKKTQGSTHPLEIKKQISRLKKELAKRS